MLPGADCSFVEKTVWMESMMRRGWVEPCDLLEHALEAGLREHIHRRPGNPEPLAS